MKKPIILNTGIDFVLIGSLLDGSGILIRDKSSTIDLIGMAKSIYSDKPQQNFNALNKTSPRYKYTHSGNHTTSYIWSEALLLDNSSRYSHFLFAVKGGIQGLSANQMNTLKNLTVNTFNTFIEDSFYELNKYSKTLDLDLNETIKSAIEWNISNLLTLIKLNFYFSSSKSPGGIIY